VVAQPLLEMRDPFAPPTEAKPPPPAPGTRRRASGDELIADLFQDMHELDFCENSIEAAGFTLTLAMEKLGTDAGVVHLYDIDRQEFVIVRTAGAGTPLLHGLRTADTDPLAAEAMRTRGTIVVLDPAGDARASGERWGAMRNAVGKPIAAIACARVAQGGRFLGLVEVVHLAGAGAFEAGDENALSYIAERFTEFVAARGVMLGSEG
jgi:GAF domain-containing protein